MDYKTIAKIIIEMKNADLKLRTQCIKNNEFEYGYNPKMKQLHNKNATLLNTIINQIGYPTTNKVGKAANAASWLIIQHAIGQPNFMKKCSKLLEIEVINGNENPLHLAYLTDRIAVFENKKQLYGTQFDWDKNGELCPQPFDNIRKVNIRRKSIGLNTLQEQTKIIRQRSKEEHQKPPKDVIKRNKALNLWKVKVGWIT